MILSKNSQTGLWQAGLLLSGFLLLGLAGVLAPAAHAQSQTYSNDKVEYTLELPSPLWHLVAELDENHQSAEWVYGDRVNGYLRIRKESMDPNLTISEFAHRYQDQRLGFLPGYVALAKGISKEERFSGRLNGEMLSFEFTQTGKAMTGRAYYLQADSKTVYVLLFTGLRDKMGSIRNQTDQIARSFHLK
jgi:hypothetical protein